MTSMKTAVARHQVHQAPTTTGCKMMRTMLTTLTGITRMPKARTSQGIFAKRCLHPCQPSSDSSV